MADTSVVTIERFFRGKQREHPDAAGELARLLVDMAPHRIHQRTPLLIGNDEDVAYVLETTARIDG